MVKKILFVSSVLYAMLFYEMANQCFADVAAELTQADAYRNIGDYEQAEATYMQIVTDYPGSEEALLAQRNLTFLYIDIGKDSKANAAFEQLIANFSEHKGIAEAIYYIAKHFNWKDKNDKATEIHQYNVENFYDDMYAMWSQVEVIYYYIRNGDDAAGDTAFDKLFSVFSGQPTLPKEVYNIAKRYEIVGKYDKAVELYQHVIDLWPNDKSALFAQSGLAISYSLSGDEDAATSPYEKLIADLSNYNCTSNEIYEIGKCFNRADIHDRDAEVHRYNVESFPGDMYAMWSQVEVTYYHIRSSNDTAADAAFDKLVTVFSQQPTLPRDIYNIAKKYEEAGKHDRSRQLYQYVINNRPKDEVIYSRMSVTLSYIGLGDEPNTTAAIEKLIVDFNDHPALPAAIFQIGEQYYQEAFRDVNEGLDGQAKEKFAKAVVVWERIIQELPPSSITPQAYDFTGDAYRRLAKYDKAIEYYTIVVDNWPDYEYAWCAQFRIGRCYEHLKYSGAMAKAEADAQITAAYERVLQNYPYCPSANAARDWLDCNVPSSKQGEQK